MYSTMAAPSVSIDLGQSADFITDPLLVISRNSRTLGPCGLRANAPFYLANRPNNNIFSVQILNPDLTVATVLTDYVLTLTFEKIK